jgi:RimJ/RimL family protein N-acetyltransferase
MFYKTRAATLALAVCLSLIADNKTLGINRMKKGTFIVNITPLHSIFFAWEEIPGKTIQLNQKIKEVSKILVPAYTKTEVTFAQQKSDEVANDFMLKSLAPLLKYNVIDWHMFEQKTYEILERFFATMDWNASSKKDDLSIFVTAHDQASGKDIGVIQFPIHPDFGQNNIKAALYGVLPLFQNRGIEQLLMSSIFAVRPDIQRIFLHTRSTNEQAINLYKKCGFVEFEGTLPNWIDLEYMVKGSSILQKTAGMCGINH